ncbi:MAG TPA: aspartyl protease family protein [Caulobacteraceae bacterium]|jgi:tetratricopeptide (TPR) repeat protein/predicted aspartyl protease|nr:aspartyl protease family protein [Caulobacteraceae bacterium]
MRLRSVSLILLLLGALSQAPQALAGCVIGKVAEFPITMRGLRPTITAKVNGVEGVFFIDTGFFFSVLAPASAAKFGMRVGPAPPNLTVYGVGGRDQVKLATANTFSVAGIDFHRMDFLVNEQGLDEGVAGLIGQNLLSHVDVEYDLANGVIRFFKPENCKGAALAYWSGDRPFSTINIVPITSLATDIGARASVNGTPIRVEFDSGSPLSILNLSAAERAGVKPTSEGVVAAGIGSGVGKQSYFRAWVGPFASFKIGDEEVKGTRLRFGDMKFNNDIDMLLGADFFLSHRLYVSNSQRKIYFTYNGGPVFNLDGKRNPSQAAASPAADAAPYADTPTDAVGFERRAAAYEARRDFPNAIADLTKAIALDPAAEDYVRRRAVCRLENRQPVLAMADLDAALRLKADDMGALLMRAELRVSVKDLNGAKADLAAADELADKDPAQRLGLARAYGAASLWDRSIAQLDLWIPANPKDDSLARALNMRCWARAMLGRDLDKALADCNAALRELPGDPRFLDSRALVHLKRGEFDQGISDYQAVLRLQPNNAWALYGRGWGRLKKGQKEEGDADIKAATALSPKLDDLAKARGLTL